MPKQKKSEGKRSSDGLLSWLLFEDLSTKDESEEEENEEEEDDE